MFIRPRVLSILTTRRCTAACDHCCVGASPRAKDAIPIERIHGLIDEAKRIPTIERIVFTGGECFLLGKDLDALIAHAHELEFQTRVITNGYWAVNEKAARERTRQLRTAGLDEMNLSTGTFHAQFVPVARVIHAAQAAAACRIATLISVETCDQSDFEDGPLERELRYERDHGLVQLVYSPWIPDAANRGVSTITHERSIIRAEPANGRCGQIMTVVSVTPLQKVTACCGFPLEELPELAIASIAGRPLDDVLRSAPNRLLQMWLHTAGPAGIAEFVARYIPGFRLPDAATICQSCITLQKDDQAMRVIAKHGMEMAASVATDFVNLQSTSSAATLQDS